MQGLYVCQTRSAGAASPLLAEVWRAAPSGESLLRLGRTRAGAIRSRVECCRSERPSFELTMGVAGHASRPVAGPLATLQQGARQASMHDPGNLS